MLDDDKMSNRDWSCYNFAPATFESVLKASDGKDETTSYKRNSATWPSSFPRNSFVNFSINFKNSLSNHNFNVYFDGDNSYLIQVYLHESIRISTPYLSDKFIRLWKQLATETWADAYKRLFYVHPDLQNNGYDEQYVTVVTGTE